MNVYRQVVVRRIRVQRGAALVVGLIGLLVLTLLGTAGMHMTSLELKIAGNMQNRNKVFQAANSMLDLVFYSSGAAPERMFFNTETPQSFGPVVIGETSSTAAGTFTSRGSGIKCPGNSLRVTCNFYRLTTKSTHTASKASSTQVLGLYKQGVLNDD